MEWINNKSQHGVKPAGDVSWDVFWVLSTCDFCLFGLHQLSHHGENVLASLRSNNEQLFQKYIGDNADL